VLVYTGDFITEIRLCLQKENVLNVIRLLKVMELEIGFVPNVILQTKKYINSCLFMDIVIVKTPFFVPPLAMSINEQV